MAGDTRTLKLSILADVDNLSRSLKQGTGEVEGFAGKLGKFGKIAGAAFAAAGVAATAYAATLLVDGVKSAIEDEAAQQKLATTLTNVAGATQQQIAATEDYITAAGLAYGVADDELRPALDRLARATGDVGEAQKLTNLAMDIAAGTGKSLEAVSNALGKAAEGNTTALGRLGVGLSAAELKTMSMEEATARLGKMFAGQADKQADTFQGKMQRLTLAFSEAKETVGSYILDAITPLVSSFVDKGLPAITALATKLGQELGPTFETVGAFVKDTLLPTIKDLAPVIGTLLVGAIKVLVPILTTTLTVFMKIATVVGTVISKIIEFGKAVADSPVGQFIGNVIDAVIPGRATGGPVTGGSPYIVGERGPELFVPRTSGRIIPNGATGGQTINITVQGAVDAEGTARTIANLLRDSAARTGNYGTLGQAGLVYA